MELKAGASHNIKNRHAEDLGPYEGPEPEHMPERRGLADAIKTLIVGSVSAEDAAAYAADAAATATDDNILANITRVARELREAQDDVVHAEGVLQAAKDRVRLLEESTLPELMDRAGQKKLTTIDGYDLTRGETVRASIPPGNLPRAIMWLNANGYGSIVKRLISLTTGKGEEQRAAEAVELLVSAGFAPTDAPSVHTSTLAASVREMMEKGVDVPKELLGVYVQNRVTMKKGGSRKAVKGTKG
jgi:hypothetical protein